MSPSKNVVSCIKGINPALPRLQIYSCRLPAREQFYRKTKFSLLKSINEVIVWMMMYAIPLLIVHAMYFQGIGIKGKEMALVWHEKASRTALQTTNTHSFGTDTNTWRFRPLCTSLPKVNLYITVIGGNFWKYLNGEFVFHVTIKIHYYFIVCRIPFLQEDVHLQSFTEQYFISNKLFYEKWVKFKMQNLPI